MRRRDRPATRIAPSLLSCDFSRIGEECKRMEQFGADMLHIDIMDGHFVPNITFGPSIVKSIRQSTTLPLDCHLMITQPWKWVRPFIQNGANSVTVHIETEDKEYTMGNICRSIKENDCRSGVALRPGTRVEDCGIINLIENGDVDMVLVMTVEPGFGGQKFMPDMMGKVKKLREMFGNRVDIQVDGGLSEQTIELAANAGANIVVAGSAIFGSEDPESVIKVLKNAVDVASTTKFT